MSDTQGLAINWFVMKEILVDFKIFKGRCFKLVDGLCAYTCLRCACRCVDFWFANSEELFEVVGFGLHGKVFLLHREIEHLRTFRHSSVEILHDFGTSFLM